MGGYFNTVHACTHMHACVHVRTPQQKLIVILNIPYGYLSCMFHRKDQLLFL